MNKAGIIIQLHLICCLLLTGCSQSTEKQPLAKAFGKSLLLDELEVNFPKGLNRQDSIQYLNKLTNAWIENQVVLNAANELPEEIREKINAKSELYKQDLLRYYYEEARVNDLLDTIISAKEMRQYFENHQENFLLGTHIIKLIFFKLKPDDQNIEEFRSYARNPSEDGKEKIAELASKTALNSYLDSESWLSFDAILKEIPIRTLNTKNFLENNNYFEIQEGPYIYLGNILDYKIKNSVSTFEFERENIKKMILQNRKRELLRNLIIDLRKEAELNNKIENQVNLK